jgi:hypothetical protein
MLRWTAVEVVNPGGVWDAVLDHLDGWARTVRMDRVPARGDSAGRAALRATFHRGRKSGGGDAQRCITLLLIAAAAGAARPPEIHVRGCGCAGGRCSPGMLRASRWDAGAVGRVAAGPLPDLTGLHAYLRAGDPEVVQRAGSADGVPWGAFLGPLGAIPVVLHGFCAEPPPEVGAGIPACGAPQAYRTAGWPLWWPGAELRDRTGEAPGVGVPLVAATSMGRIRVRADADAVSDAAPLRSNQWAWLVPDRSTVGTGAWFLAWLVQDS